MQWLLHARWHPSREKADHCLPPPPPPATEGSRGEKEPTRSYSMDGNDSGHALGTHATGQVLDQTLPALLKKDPHDSPVLQRRKQRSAEFKELAKSRITNS